jgi:hypothetical protein
MGAAEAQNSASIYRGGFQTMKLSTSLLLVGALLVPCVAQSQTGAQADTKASARPGKTQASGSGSANGSASAQAGKNNAAISNGTTFNAALNNSVDAKKCKPGDGVTAHTTEAVKSDGQTVLPKGTKLVGHVTEAKARANGESQSSLGIVFDRAILKNGQEVPFNGNIQALAAAQSTVASGPGELDAMGSGMGSASGSGMGGGRGSGMGGGRSSGGVLGGVTSTTGGTVGAVTNTAGSVGGGATNTVGGTVASTTNVTGAAGSTVGGLNTAGQLTSNSRGVFGLNGLNLSSAASNSTQGSLITSAGKNVHLDSGTRMLLVAQSQASAGGSAQK